MKKKGQQEMVGFVLIVVLVVIALMIFLIISVRQPVELQDNVALENLLASILKSTTECAIVFEPDYDSGRDLIKSCFDNKRCTNLGEGACEYLEKYFSSLVEDAVQSENAISAYELDIYAEDLEGRIIRDLLGLTGGECEGTLVGTSDRVSSSSGDIVIEFKACYFEA